MKGKARATRRTLNKVDPVSDKKPVGFESVQTDLGASTSRTQWKGSGRPSAPVPTNEAATSAVACTGVASQSLSAPVPTNEVIASVVVQTDISDADQTASTSRSLFGLHLPKDLVFTKKGKSLPQLRFSISWTPGQNVLEHSTDRWSIFRDGLEENSLISDMRISSIEEALKKSFPALTSSPSIRIPSPTINGRTCIGFPVFTPKPSLRIYMRPTHSGLSSMMRARPHIYSFILLPLHGISLTSLSFTTDHDLGGHYKILEPKWLIQREKIASRLKQCILVFKTVSNIADFISLSLPKPDECKFDVLKDWDRLLDRHREPEMQRAIKLLFMHVLDLRAWALWALFKVIDFLASLHELPPPHFPITGEIIGCTLFSSSPGANPELEFGEYLEPLRMTIPSTIRRPLPTFGFPPIMFFTQILGYEHCDNNKEFCIDIFGVIHSIYPQTFGSFQLPESLPEEEGSPPPGPVVREPCRDLLKFGQQYQKAPDLPMFDDTEEGLVKFEATHERYDQEEREAQHHPYGALLITQAYLGIGEAQQEVGNIITGMADKNNSVKPPPIGTFLVSSESYELGLFLDTESVSSCRMNGRGFLIVEMGIRAGAARGRLSRLHRQQLSREYLQLIGEFTEPQANPIPVTANEDTGVAGSLQAKTRGPVKEFIEPPTHSAAAAASGIMGLAGPLQTRMHDPVSQTHGGEQSAPLHMSGASGSGSMELDEGHREVGSRTTQHSASRVET
ncbi:uncharacterized protein EI90DRAFT_3117336 [Cantharellus anzutake]|uniref:uncharacterized protein n=1 Tax=Cantharellus anzutake TaxID=1750568 RepID=UPI001903DD5F|nr:uncharacterized protein EI90DRAFT_3117336 [Cantharellus anzutake]KAF8339512.1 hypothetical protein EI90DRAFT_3117336 [Cantharellus anzutake]